MSVLNVQPGNRLDRPSIPDEKETGIFWTDGDLDGVIPNVSREEVQIPVPQPRRESSAG